MAIRDTLVGLPSNLKTPATVSLTAGTAAAAFPVTNLKDGMARTPFKATGTSCTIRAHFAAPVTLEGFVLSFHNLAGATVALSNPAGLNQAVTIPANSEDGHCIDPWLDLRGVANATDDDWDLTISGAAANVAIGELVFVGTWSLLLLDRGADVAEDHPAIVHPTDYHPHAHVYRKATRVRYFAATTADEVTTAIIRSLHRGAKGPYTPFPLIPDLSINDALYGHLSASRHSEQEAGPRGSGWRPTSLAFVESPRGLAL